MSDFRVAYSKLIRAVWDDGSLEAKITADPSLLKSYGFSTVPSSVTFKSADGPASIAGYDDQLHDIGAGPTTIYIPPKPSLGNAPGSDQDVQLGGDACCCCCPCCTCT